MLFFLKNAPFEKAYIKRKKDKQPNYVSQEPEKEENLNLQLAEERT